MSELLPCPFCSGTAKDWPHEAYSDHKIYQIGCVQCGATAAWADSVEEAQAAWNKRFE